MKLLGEVVEHERCLCLRTSPGVYYPLGGNSGLAEDFTEAFGPALPLDVGKLVYKSNDGVLQMENETQRDTRKLKEATRAERIETAARDLLRDMETPRSRKATVAWDALHEAIKP